MEDVTRPSGVPVGRLFRYLGRVYVRCRRVELGQHANKIIAVEINGDGTLLDYDNAPIDGMEPPYQTDPLT